LADGGGAPAVFGTALRAIGRGFGNGTFASAEASKADNPAASATLALRAVHRIAVARPNQLTALFPGESSNRASPSLFH
jgi:hypothetical protein